MKAEKKESQKTKREPKKETQKADNQSRYTHVSHTFQPVFNEESRVLVLGTFPSVKSREGMFYYHHPQNRFWNVMARLCGEETPRTESS